MCLRRWRDLRHVQGVLTTTWADKMMIRTLQGRACLSGSVLQAGAGARLETDKDGGRVGEQTVERRSRLGGAQRHRFAGDTVRALLTRYAQLVRVGGWWRRRLARKYERCRPPICSVCAAFIRLIYAMGQDLHSDRHEKCDGGLAEVRGHTTARRRGL